MKRLLFPVTAAFCILSLAACVPKQEPKPPKKGGFHQPQEPVPPTDETAEEPPDKPAPKKDETTLE